MPIIQITLVEGRDDQIVSECVREVARTVSRTLDAPLSSVRVYVNAVQPQFFAVGDVTKADSAKKAELSKG
jgi:4-oxalocrotonate tautomerase family enzyme